MSLTRSRGECTASKRSYGRMVLALSTIAVVLAADSSNANPAAPAFWGFDGHRIVCEIAWQELTEETREKINSLIRQDPEYSSFSESCVWADVFRQSGDLPEWEDAHFVNVDRAADWVSAETYCTDEFRLCVVQAIPVLERALRESTAAPSRQLESLKLLAHFVGDLHQPLHVGYEDDSGGNRIRVELNGSTRSLHSVWDTELIRLGNADWRDYAQLLHADITTVQRRLWQYSSVEFWATESLETAQTAAYAGVEPSAPLTDEYLDRGLRVIELQLARAGVRLALLLERALMQSK